MNIDIQNFYVSVRDLLKIKKNHVSELVWTQGDFLRKKLNDWKGEAYKWVFSPNISTMTQ